MFYYTCEPDSAAMFTCIYEAWASGKGHHNIRLCVEPVEQYTLFDTYIHVDADESKAEKVVRTLQTQLSHAFFEEISFVTLSAQEDALDTIYRVMILGFAFGPKALEMYQYKEVVRFWEIRKRVKREVHLFPEFLRFVSLEGGLLLGHFEPRDRVLIPVSWAFEDRMPSENWMIVDDVHRMAVVHQADKESVLRILTDEEFEKLCEAEQYKDDFTKRWQIFFEHIAIRERANSRCQQTLFPKWMRKHVTEFQK